jgi:hypothetical protein
MKNDKLKIKNGNGALRAILSKKGDMHEGIESILKKRYTQ